MVESEKAMRPKKQARQYSIRSVRIWAFPREYRGSGWAVTGIVIAPVLPGIPAGVSLRIPSAVAAEALPALSVLADPHEPLRGVPQGYGLEAL